MFDILLFRLSWTHITLVTGCLTGRVDRASSYTAFPSGPSAPGIPLTQTSYLCLDADVNFKLCPNWILDPTFTDPLFPGSFLPKAISNDSLVFVPTSNHK